MELRRTFLLGRRSRLSNSGRRCTWTTATTIAGAVLGCGVASLLVIWLYFMYHYVWVPEREFTSTAGIIIYIVLPPLLAILLAYGLQLRPAFRINLALVCLSVVISIYGTELLLGAYQRFGARFDTRTIAEVVQDFRNRRIDAVPAVFGSNLLTMHKEETGKARRGHSTGVLLPLGGISNKLTVLCNEAGQYVTYRSDEHGFHNPYGIWNSADVTIAAVGDSFALGACVPSDRNFVALIRKRYPRTINLGVSGSGPLYQLAVVREYLPVLKPKATVWCYYEGNDEQDLLRERRSALLMQYMEERFGQGLIGRQEEIDQVLTAYLQMNMPRNDGSSWKQAAAHAETVIKLPALRRRLGLVYGVLKEDTATSAGVDLISLQQILEKARALTRAWHGMLYFAYLPQWGRYAQPPSSVDRRAAIMRSVTDMNIPVIDVHQTFRHEPDPLSVFPDRRDAHYNEKGHWLVSAAIMKGLAHSYDQPH